MTDISPPKENDIPINTENLEDKLEENKEQIEQQEIQEPPNYLNIYQSFSLNPLEQILINKLIPYGYKLETEENLLKTDEKKKKGYLHRKHKRTFGNNKFQNEDAKKVFRVIIQKIKKIIIKQQ